MSNDSLSEATQALIRHGKALGYLHREQIEEVFPLNSFSEAELEDALRSLEVAGIEVFDSAAPPSSNGEAAAVHDPTSDFPAEIAARNEFVIDIDLKGDGTELARGFFKLQSQSQEGAVGALEVENLTFVLNVPQIENPALQFPFGWQHDGASLMSTALQKCIDAFQNETKLRVQYLPSGAPGQSPLDGAQTEAVVTDLSVSSGLSDVVTFQVAFQGDGGITTV